MLENPKKGVFYVPVSRELLPELEEWSEPVQIRLRENPDGEAQLELRHLPEVVDRFFKTLP